MRMLSLLSTLLLVALAARADEAYWGRPGAAGGTCCGSLAEVRGNIDRIDAAIVALIAERGQYVAEAARFKPDAARVADPRRVEQVIARVRTLAVAAKAPPEVVEATYRAMVEAFTRWEAGIAVERAVDRNGG